MPLWIILTKWPAPSVPTWVTQGSPSATAAIEVRMGPSVSYAFADPPGMIEGPSRAPSSPPEMPAPTKLRPSSRAAFSLLMVSVNSELPPSTMMSPSSNRAESSAITASVPRPACTMTMAVRGFWRDATKSSTVSEAINPASGCSSSSVLVRAQVRLYTATVLPSRLARFRARLEPITAMPTTPMFATPMFPADCTATGASLYGVGIRCLG